MTKYNLKILIISVFGTLASLFFAVQASAMTPSLTITTSSYNTLQVTVYGDANSPVILDYWSNQQLMGAGIIGYTSSGGYFSTQLNPNGYNIPNGSQVIVIVNGQQSNVATWQNSGYNPYPYNSGVVSLSQNNITLAVGQSQTISIYGNYNYYNSYYISNSLSSGVVNATISGPTLTLYAQSAGSSTVTVCSTYNYNYYYNTNNCASVYVTVTQPYYGYGYNTGSSVQLTVGGTAVMNIRSNYIYGYGSYYNYGNYYVTNSSSYIASGTISGSTLTIYGTSPGVTTLYVCSSYGGNRCVPVTVTVSTQNLIF